MRAKNSIISSIGFCISAIGSMMLFAGAFVSRTDYIKAHLGDTLFFLILGALVPISFIIGVIFLVKSIQQKEFLFVLPIVLGILSLLATFVYYGIVVPLIIELLKYNWG